MPTNQNGTGTQLYSYELSVRCNETNSMTHLGVCSFSVACRHHCKFTGKERDTETGLDYFGARYYASNMGRFMSPDEPLADQNTGDPQSCNLYSYVRNNPLANTDPTGNACVNGKDFSGTGVRYWGKIASLFGRSAEKAVITGTEQVALDTTLKISEHALEEAAKDGVTKDAIQTVIKVGEKYYDPQE